MKKNLIMLSLCTAFVLCVIFAAVDARASAKNISDNVVRLHIPANSDSEYDQSVKLAVRDAIVEETGALLEGVTAESEAEQIISQNLELFENVAQRVLLERGASYSASVSYGLTDFPTRVYGEVRLPAGKYNSLVITLGEGGGKNWWCIMFPPLCYEGESSDSAVAILEDNLSEGDFYIVAGGEKTVIKFKIIELLAEIFG